LSDPFSLCQARANCDATGRRVLMSPAASVEISHANYQRDASSFKVVVFLDRISVGLPLLKATEQCPAFR
jgi:hypothetical protein